MIEYEVLTPTEVYLSTLALARKIRSSYKPDHIIGISRGGLGLAWYLADFLNKEKVYMIGAKRYPGVDVRQQEVEIYQDLPPSLNLRKSRVLLVDDIWDEGPTIGQIKSHIEETKSPREIKTAVLHYKPMRNILHIKPDFYIFETERWVSLPKEWCEDIIAAFKRRLFGEGLNEKEIVEKLIGFGIWEEIIDYVLEEMNVSEE